MKTISREEFEEEFENGDCDRLSDDIIEQSRWSTLHEYIYLNTKTGKYYKVIWDLPSTECSGDPDDEVDVCEVEPYQVTVTQYREVKDA